MYIIPQDKKIRKQFLQLVWGCVHRGVLQINYFGQNRAMNSNEKQLCFDVGLRLEKIKKYLDEISKLTNVVDQPKPRPPPPIRRL